MTYKIYIILFFALFAVSCGGGSSDDPVPPIIDPIDPSQPTVEPDLSVAFSPQGIDVPTSRAPQALEDTHQHIRVFGYKTTASGTETVMPGYHVMWMGADSWQYDAARYPTNATLAGQFLKYWDGSAQSYEFCGYAPMTDANKDMTSLDFGTLQAHVDQAAAASYDYLVSHHERAMSPLVDTDLINGAAFTAAEHAPTVFYDIVPLRFHHIFSQVEFRLCNVGNNAASLTKAVVRLEDYDNVHYFVSGAYEGMTGWTCTFEDWSADGCLLNKDYDPAKIIAPIPAEYNHDETYLLAETIEVPQSMQGKVVVVTVEIDETPISKAFTLPENWDYDKRYIYYITFKTSDQRPIFVDVIANDFLRGEIINNTQTNW